MRIVELEIDKVRGIQHLHVKPDGENFVIWGPNGSGKSAVVDAIDFLLTGEIQRLTGKGTGDITLARHGPHVDHKPEDSVVRAIIELPNSRKRVELKRSIGEPNRLERSDGDGNLEKVLELAKQGLHILSRREILKFVTADASSRAQEIQELLNISEVEKTRTTLVRVQNDFLRELKSAGLAVRQGQSRVNATVQEKKFQEDIVLKVVNKNRKVLGVEPISELSSGILKRGLKSPTVLLKTESLNVTLVERDIQNLKQVISEKAWTEIVDSDARLRDIIKKIKANPDLMHTLARIKLIKFGMDLIDETGKCPLCDKSWPPGELLEYLQERLKTAKIAGRYQVEIGTLVNIILTRVNNTIASLQKVIATVKIAGLNGDRKILESWLDSLRKLSDALNSVVESYLETGFSPDEIKRMVAPENVLEALTNIERIVKKKYPESPPEQTAWDTLTRLEENLGSLESLQNDKRNARLFAKRSIILHDRFLLARDKILCEIYDTVRDRFVQLYRGLHGDDESEFSATIRPDEAGLDLEVEFYGRGAHPPHALHSEGHQDSMGLCLYLALAELLTKGLIDLVILDDVVMSVDAGHRRDVCRLLATSFPKRQFLITTHDKTWANQLKSEGVVASKRTIEFYNWSLEMGPQVNYQVDMWERIEEDLRKGDPISASQKLRRGCEEFFGAVCDALHSEVRYRLNGRWELGDFLPAAMSRYRGLLKKAKSVAHSWGDIDCFDELSVQDSTVGQIYSRCGAEQWAVNANVHYNNWANFSSDDFQPVVDAFQDLCAVFLCSKCGGMLHVTTSGIRPVGVQCNCGVVHWNLEEREKTK